MMNYRTGGGLQSPPAQMNVAESILKTLTEPVLILDKSLKAVMANPAFCQVMGARPGEIRGLAVEELIVEERNRKNLLAILDDVAAHDFSIEGAEIVCVVPPDLRKVLTLNAHRVIVNEHPSALILVELRDITRQRESELTIQALNESLRRHGGDLEETNRELEAFTHSVSHDLRTPLRFTNKILTLLLNEQGPELPPGAADKIRMILSTVHEMGKLAESLLAFSQLRHEPVRRRRIDLRRVANEAMLELQDEKRAREVRFTIDDLPACRADRALMKQVLLNLLSNALKFTRHRDTAEIHLGFTESNGETAYFVRDNGIGFDSNQQDKLFLVFQRLHKQQDFEGSGVGLALVKRIIDRHGGRIWAESELDHGSTFYFMLGEQPGGQPPSNTEASRIEL